MNRRNFLQSVAVFSWAVICGKNAFAQKDVSETVKTEVEDLINLENIKKIEKSILSVGLREFNFFVQFFSIEQTEKNYSSLVVSKIKELQKEFQFSQKSQDGVLGSSTLRNLYLEYYIKNKEKLSEDQIQRIRIYEEMLWYEKKPGALYQKLDVFSHMTYFWKDAGWNLKGTYINEKISWKIPEEIPEKINKILIFKHENKKILAFYIAGKLYLATFVSPGLLAHKTPKLKTKWKTKPDLYHTSSEYPEAAKKKNGKKWWAIMPYAVHIDGPIWFHGSDGNIDGNPQSHGCIRTPLFYIKEIFEKVKELGIENVSIDTTAIY